MKTKTALCLLALCVGSPADARGPYGTIKIGGWTGGAFTNNETGQFSSCIASAPYKSGITFFVMVSANVTWNIGFSKDTWTLTPGSTFPIVLTFDGKQPFNVTGHSISRNTVSVSMPDNSDLIRQFRASSTMSAFAQGNLFQFNLDRTSVLLPALVNCVQTINRDGLAGAKDFVAPAKPQIAASQPQAQTTNRSPDPGSSLRPSSGPSNPELQIEAVQLASNFILKASLTNPRVLGASEAPTTLVNNGAAWKSDDATGFVRIIPASEGVKGLDVASNIVANDAKDCKGKFASARNSELVDSDVVFRGMSSCDDSERSNLSQYFIVPRKAGGFVMFAVISNLRSEDAKSPVREQKNTDFRKAALVAVGP